MKLALYVMLVVCAVLFPAEIDSAQPAALGLDILADAAKTHQIVFVKVKIQFAPLETVQKAPNDYITAVLRSEPPKELVENFRTFYLAPSDCLVISEILAGGQVAESQHLWRDGANIFLRRQTPGKPATTDAMKVDFRTAAMRKLPGANDVGLLLYLAYYLPAELESILSQAGQPFSVQSDSTTYSVFPVVSLSHRQFLCVNDYTHRLERVITIPSKTLVFPKSSETWEAIQRELKEKYDSLPKYILSEEYSYELRDPNDLKKLLPKP